MASELFEELSIMSSKEIMKIRQVLKHFLQNGTFLAITDSTYCHPQPVLS